MNSPMLQPNALKGKTIVITGGGTGLGKAIATGYSQLGANVVITSRRQNVLDDTSTEITQLTGNPVLGVACDVRHYEEVEAMMERSISEFGQVNGLLNNAAGNFISPTERLSHRAFKIIIDIVLNGTINCTLAFGKRWIKEKQEATILNIVTTYAWTGSSFVVPSATAKAGVVALIRSLAVEWAKYGIRNNGIAPGPFPTKGAWDRLLPGELNERMDMAKEVPLKRVGKHHELADLAAYLMSDYSAYVNGEIVTIDGGEWLQGAGEFNFLDALSQEEWDSIEREVRKAGK